MVEQSIELEAYAMIQWTSAGGMVRDISHSTKCRAGTSTVEAVLTYPPHKRRINKAMDVNSKNWSWDIVKAFNTEKNGLAF